VGNVVVERGSIETGAIPVVGYTEETTTQIPVTVINGAGDGPILAVVAGIHGAEYAPIIAMHRIVGQIGAEDLNGAVIVVHIANLPAFSYRTIYVGPHDLKNLNRSFPGDPEGTTTERIAAALTEHVIDGSDYLIDVHSGDANESLRPSYSAYYADAGSESVIEESHRIARAFGLDFIVRFRGPIDSPDKAIYTSAQAVARGIPAMDVESGELGRTTEPFVRPIVSGVLSVMRELDMLPGTPDTPVSPVYINERARVYSEHDGVWHKSDLVETGDFVGEGTVLGRITDYHGHLIEEIRAPADGILLILFGTPPVNRGDNLVVIGAVD
jgi:predicted deacylase